jgi:hypothetical protein
MYENINIGTYVCLGVARKCDCCVTSFENEEFIKIHRFSVGDLLL